MVRDTARLHHGGRRGGVRGRWCSRCWCGRPASPSRRSTQGWRRRRAAWARDRSTGADASRCRSRPPACSRRVARPMPPSLGEFGAVITFAANIPGETQTLPLAIYAALQAPGGEAQAARLALASLVLAGARLAAGGAAGAAAEPLGRPLSLEVDAAARLAETRRWTSHSRRRRRAWWRCSVRPASARACASLASPGCCGRMWPGRAGRDGARWTRARGVWVPAGAAAARRGVPGCAAVPAPRRSRATCATGCGGRGATALGPCASTSWWRCSGSERCCGGGRARYRAASGSGWRSAGRCCRARACW